MNVRPVKLWLPLVLQYATDYKMVAAGNDSNGTTLYQKVGASVAAQARPNAARALTCAFSDNQEVLEVGFGGFSSPMRRTRPEAAVVYFSRKVQRTVSRFFSIFSMEVM